MTHSELTEQVNRDLADAEQIIMALRRSLAEHVNRRTELIGAQKALAALTEVSAELAENSAPGESNGKNGRRYRVLRGGIPVTSAEKDAGGS